MPSDLVLKSMNMIHRGVLALSFGKLGWDAGGMPVLELTTTRFEVSQLEHHLEARPRQPIQVPHPFAAPTVRARFRPSFQTGMTMEKVMPPAKMDSTPSAARSERWRQSHSK